MKMIDGLPKVFQPVCDGCFDYLLTQREVLVEVFEKAEILGDLSVYPENKFGPLTVLDYLDLVEMQAEHYTKRALVAEEKLRKISEFTTKDDNDEV